MKKILLFATLLCALLLVACGEKPATSTPAADDPDGNVAVSGDCTITVENDDAKGAITFTDADGKTMTSCKKGDTVTITVSPTMGYEVKSFTVSGKELALNNGAITLRVNGDFQISVAYEEITYTRETNPILQARRNTVVEHAAHIVGDYFIYTENKEILPSDLGENGIRFTEGYGIQNSIVYRGMPYNLGLTSLQALKLDSIGTLDGTVDGEFCTVTKIDNSNYINKWYTMYGASCADVVLYSWAQVSGKLTISAATEMTPEKGSAKIGEYTATVHGNACANDCKCRTSAPHLVGTYVDTKADCDLNTRETMFAAYSLLLPADACTSGAHAILITDVEIAYNTDGSINGDYSYVLYHDTYGAANNTGLVMEIDGAEYEVYSSCSYNGRKTFNKLFDEGYLPVTCPRLLSAEEEYTPEVTDSVKNADATNMFKGIISANSPISHVVMTITDKDGNVVQKAVRFWTDNTTFHVEELQSRYHEWCGPSAIFTEENTIRLGSLPAGDYHCTLTVSLCNGYETNLRDFDFTL